jgi:hypothetical protein
MPYKKSRWKIRKGKNKVTHYKKVGGFLKMAHVIELHRERYIWSILAGSKVHHQ